MYTCESWTIKKAEHWRIDAFELWCWRRLLRVPWTASRSNQSILQEISPEYSLEGLMLKLKLPYCGHMMQKNWLVGKDSDAGKDWRQDEKGTTEYKVVGWHHQLNGHEFEQDPGAYDRQGGLACCSPWGHKESDMTEWLNSILGAAGVGRGVSWVTGYTAAGEVEGVIWTYRCLFRIVVLVSTTLAAEGLLSHAPLQLKAWDHTQLPLLLISGGQVFGCGWKVRVSCTASPDAARFSGPSRLSSLGHLSGITSTICTIPLVTPPLWVPIQLPFDVQLCGIFQGPGMLGRGTFAELWMFYWWQFE